MTRSSNAYSQTKGTQFEVLGIRDGLTCTLHVYWHFCLFLIQCSAKGLLWSMNKVARDLR